MISIGDMLTLELKDSGKREKYRCKLVDKNDSKLYINYPVDMETNKTVYLLDGTELKCSFASRDGSIYEFETEILGRLKNNIPMLILFYPGNDHLMKIQRRAFVRVETSVDVAIHPFNVEFEPFTAVTDDISAGGCAVICDKPFLKPGVKVLCWFVLPMQSGEYHYVKFLSKVVRVFPVDGKKSKVSLQFLNVRSNQQQKIIRFCFDRQLMMRKKGLT